MHDIALFVWNHIEAIVGLLIGAGGLVFGLLKGNKYVGIVQQSQAAIAFLALAERIAENVAHELQKLADGYRDDRAKAEASFKLGLLDADGWAKAQVAYERNMSGLKNIGISMIWQQVGDQAPAWMKNAYSHIGPILEKVLALTREARGLFSARSSTPEPPAAPTGESK